MLFQSEMKAWKTLKQLSYILYNEDFLSLSTENSELGELHKLLYMNCVGDCKTNKTHDRRLSSSSPESPYAKCID